MRGLGVHTTYNAILFSGYFTKPSSPPEGIWRPSTLRVIYGTVGIHLIRWFHPWHETGLRNRISYILWPFLGLLSNGHLSYSQKLKSPFMDVGKFSQNILFWLTKITAVAYFTFFCFEGRVVELAASRSYFTTKRVYNRHYTNKYNR